MRIKDRAKPKIPPVEPGVYMAVCVGVIDLGEQYSEKFKNYSNNVKLVWELVGETCTIDGEEKPRQLSKDFTFSTSKKGKLRSFLSAWNGKAYTDDEFQNLEIFDQVGKACQLQVSLSENKEYSNVTNIMALPKGVAAPTTDTPPILWDMEHWDDAVFDMLPAWTQEQIKKSTEYQKEHAPADPVTVEGAARAAAADSDPADGGCPI